MLTAASTSRASTSPPPTSRRRLRGRSARGRARPACPVTIVTPRASARRASASADLAGAALREREAVPLPERGEEEAEEAAERRVRRQVGVQRVAREQQRSSFALEALVGEGAHGLERHPPELAQPARPEPGEQRDAGAHRRHRRREPAQERRLDPRPEPHQLPPRVTVARRRTRRATRPSRRGPATATTQRPSGVGCASTSGPCRQRTPQRSSSIARIAGDETASG